MVRASIGVVQVRPLDCRRVTNAYAVYAPAFFGRLGAVTHADWVKTIELKNPGLFGRFFQCLPTGGDARHKGLARLSL